MVAGLRKDLKVLSLSFSACVEVQLVSNKFIKGFLIVYDSLWFVDNCLTPFLFRSEAETKLLGKRWITSTSCNKQNPTKK